VFNLPTLFGSSPGSSASDPSSSSSSPGFAALLLLLPVGIGAVFTLLSWIARTYTVGADELTIDEGIVRRRRRVVPYRRVQQIDMDQKLIPQLLRVGVLTIETAGTAGGKVKLGLLDVRVARGLRSHVLERRAALQGTLRTPPGPAVPRPGDPKPGVTGPGFAAPSPWPGAPAIPPPEAGTKAFQPERVVLHLTPKRLVLAAVTHHNVIASLPILLLAGVGIGALTVPANRDVGAIVVLAVALGIGLGVWVALVAVVVLNQVLTQYGYTLSEQGDDLHLRFGLLQVRNLTIPRRRVQHLTVIDNPVRRAIGLVGVQLHSAAPPTASARPSAPPSVRCASTSPSSTAPTSTSSCTRSWAVTGTSPSSRPGHARPDAGR
jgi:putative membrane protein